MMKKLLVLLCLFSITSNYAQEEYKAPRLRKIPIGGSGCYAYMPSEEITFDLSLSEDSSEVYMGDYKEGEFNYAVIVVKMKSTVLETTEEKTTLLESYMDYLKSAFGIENAVGYGEGHTLESNPNAIGVIDYWLDAESNTWQVKGWVDATSIGIMMIYGPREYPNFNVQQMYLDGFRFN